MARPTVDIAIAGNGILAQSVALILRDRSPDARVALIGPGVTTGAATSAAGAMLGHFGEVTKYTMASGAGRAKFELGRLAHAAWPAWLDRLAQDAPPGSAVRAGWGTFVVENGRSGALDSENYDSLRATLDAYGEPYEAVRASDIPGLDPVPDARPIRAVFLPGEGWVDARSVLGRLAVLIRRAGTSCVEERAVAVRSNAGRVTGVELEDGSFVAAGTVIVAAGAFSQPLLESVVEPGTVQPVFAGSGVAFVATRESGTGFSQVVRTVNRAGSCGLHVVPLGGGVEYVGATNVIFRQPETRASPGVCHFLAECAMEQLDTALASSRIDEWRVGNRPVALDTFPLVGWGPVDGLYVLTGTYRDGFHQSPVLAEICAAEILGGTQPIEHPFCPTRHPITTTSAEESIDEFVLQSISSGFESGIRIPRFWDRRDLDRMFRPLAETLYETLGIDWGLPTDVIHYLAVWRKQQADVTAVKAYLDRCSGRGSGGNDPVAAPEGVVGPLEGRSRRLGGEADIHAGPAEDS